MEIWLLVRDPTCQSPLDLNGQHWVLESFEFCEDETQTGFSCVSYSWGAGREQSPLDKDFEISDRTIPSLVSALDSDSSITHIWIDALCVPLADPERTLTLQSMGHIYATAKEVVVVLSANTNPVLQTMMSFDQIGTEEMEILEKDEWISRGWTYQETVNCQSLKITCHQTDDFSFKPPVVLGSDFLNYLGFSLSKLPYPPHQRRDRYPNLDAFDNVIADYMTAGYAERSALQVMSIMEKRVLTNPDDQFYAMIGAITKEPAKDHALSAAEAFMDVCERKGDYSFIFSAADRDEHPRKRWRPKSTLNRIPTLVAWPVIGSHQPGYTEGEQLFLEEIVTLKEGNLTDGAQNWINRKLDLLTLNENRTALQRDQLIFDLLRDFGFAGSANCFTLTEGYFFPYRDISLPQDCTFIISLSVWWSFGAPGLMSFPSNDVGELSYVPGVLFGKPDSHKSYSIAL